MGGQARFGPDVEWVDRLDYNVDPEALGVVLPAIRRYWPGLPDGALAPGYSGMRPKLQKPGEPAKDFMIEARRTMASRAWSSSSASSRPASPPRWRSPTWWSRSWRRSGYLPPLTLSVWPVIQLAWSDAKNSTAWTMSSGLPRRFSAIESTRRFWPSAP
jgi:hypothetical protein